MGIDAAIVEIDAALVTAGHPCRSPHIDTHRRKGGAGVGAELLIGGSRLAKVSATTGPTDIRSITGCSLVRSPAKSPRFLPIPHDISDLRNRRSPANSGI